MSPYTGKFFRSSNFSFIEGRAYPFSDFVKYEEYENKGFIVTAAMYNCGLTITTPKISNISPLKPYFDKSGEPIFNTFVIELDKGDLKNSYISFTEGAADACTTLPPESKAFVFSVQNKKDKLTFTIKKKGSEEDDEYNGNIVKVSKHLYDKMKIDCSNININELSKIKNLMVGSAVTSGIGTLAGIAGTTMGAISIANNKKKNDTNLNNKLDIGQTVTSSIGTATSATSLTTSAISVDKLIKIIEDMKKCKQSATNLGIIYN